MIPFADENPTRTLPVVVFALIAANVVVLLYQLSLPPSALQAFISTWAAVPAKITHGAPVAPGLPYPAWITILTSMFMHGGLLHLGGNMLYLWIFGNNIEDALGHVRFLFFYLLCGVLAMAAQVLVAPGAGVPALGASGAIAGVLGAYAVRYPRARVLTLLLLFPFLIRVVRLPALWVLGFWFVLQLIPGALSLGFHQAGGIAYFAHIGGFLAGCLLIRFFLPLPRRPRPSHPGYPDQAARLPPA